MTSTCVLFEVYVSVAATSFPCGEPSAWTTCPYDAVLRFEGAFLAFDTTGEPLPEKSRHQPVQQWKQRTVASEDSASLANIAIRQTGRLLIVCSRKFGVLTSRGALHSTWICV